MTSKCPRRMITEDSAEWLALYRHYKAGFLAVTGGVIDQPRSFFEAMQIIEGQVSNDG